MISEWQALNASATRLANQMPSDMQPAFFQLVLHPVRAAATVGTMWIYAGINNLRASQARVSANDYADMVGTLFEQDYDLELEYHSILDGKHIDCAILRDTKFYAGKWHVLCDVVRT